MSMISRQKLIEELDNLSLDIELWTSMKPNEIIKVAIEAYRHFVMETINSQPPADSGTDICVGTNQWIPCSDPPKESGYYMACIYDSEVDNYDFRKTWFAHVDDYNMEESEWRELYDYETVTAWMPLPEPYKGVE